MDDKHESENELELPDDSLAAESDDDVAAVDEIETDSAPGDAGEVADEVADDTADEAVAELEAESESTESEDVYADEDQSPDDEVGEEYGSDLGMDLPMPDADIDFLGALAQVSALSDVLAEQEARESQEMARIAARQQEERARMQWRADHVFPRPPVMVVERGRPVSFIPALLLIVLGAYLTYVTTSASETDLNTGLLLAGVGVALGVLLLVYWMASGRWLYGSLFGGLSLIFSVGVLFWLSRNDDPGSKGWPLVVSAIGVAAILSAILAVERRGYQAFAGLLLMLAGIIGMAMTTDALGTEVTDLAQSAGPIALVVIVVLIVIPGLFRRRG